MYSKKYLKRMSIKRIGIYAFLGLYFLNIFINEPENIWIVYTSILIPLGLFAYIFKTNKSREAKMLKTKTIDMVIKSINKRFNSKIIRSSSEINVLYYYLKALAFCYYGCFDDATETINKVNWDKEESGHRSYSLIISALICYLQDGDYREGLRLSRIAHKIQESYGKPYANNYSLSFVTTMVNIGTLLNEESSHNDIENLEKMLKNVEPSQCLLIAWCLSIVYKKLGNDSKSKEYRDYCRDTAPYCTPFFNEAS